MDFGILPKTLELVAALGLALNISLVPVQEANLASPKSQDYSLEILKLNSDIEMVTEPNKEPEIVTVEKPEISEVVRPPQKPTPKKSDTKNIEIIKEVKAQEATPSPSVSPSPTPTQEPTTPSSGSTTTDANGERLFQMVNDHRAKLGLASFEKDSRLCEIATKRAPMVNSELKSGTLHKGFKELNLPFWATENIAAYSTIEQDLKFWLEDYIHRVAIEGTHKYSCVACTGASCSQIFTSFVKK